MVFSLNEKQQEITLNRQKEILFCEMCNLSKPAYSIQFQLTAVCQVENIPSYVLANLFPLSRESGPYIKL